MIIFLKGNMNICHQKIKHNSGFYSFLWFLKKNIFFWVWNRKDKESLVLKMQLQVMPESQKFKGNDWFLDQQELFTNSVLFRINRAFKYYTIALKIILLYRMCKQLQRTMFNMNCINYNSKFIYFQAAPVLDS